MDKLDELLDKISDEDPHEVILTGDFNAHNAAWYGSKTDKKGLDMQDLLDKHSLRQMVNQPTYFTNGPAGPVVSLLDLVCVRQPNLVVSNEVVGSIYDKCHHHINQVKINLHCFHPPPYQRQVWHFARADKDSIQRACRMYDWEGEIDRINDPDSLAELLGEVTKNISKNFIPNEEKTFRPGEPPWLTKNCKNVYRKYSRYYKCYVRRGYPAAEKERVDALKLTH